MLDNCIRNYLTYCRYNFISMTMNGPGHILKNFVLDFMHLITNEGKFVWASLVNAEHGIERFLHLTGRSTCPWHVTPQSLEYVTELLEGGSLKVRSGYGRESMTMWAIHLPGK